MNLFKTPTQRNSIHQHSISTVLGLPFTKLTAIEAVEKCEELIHENNRKHVVTANADFLARADQSHEIRKLLFEADEVLCDGMPLVWASKLMGRESLPERVTGSDLVPRLLERCADRGFRVFFFGADEETLDALESKLAMELPDLEIAGKTSPPIGDLDSWDNERYLEEIKEAEPDLLLVALGFPKQDEWIEQYAKSADVPLSIGVGASLDFLVGKQFRSPKWIQRIGFEWLWRLGTNPRRLAGRYATDFWALTKLTAKQLFWNLTTSVGVTAKRRVSQRALLNGIDTREFQVAVFEAGRPLTLREPNCDPKAIICDCSGIDRVSSDVINAVISMRRDAGKKNIKFAVFSPPPSLSLWLRLFKLDSLVQAFDSPIALRAYVSPETAIRVPDGSIARRAEKFETISRELFGNCKTTVLQMEISQFGKVTKNTATCLDNIIKRAESSGSKIQITKVSPESRDIMEILGVRQSTLLT